MLAIRSFPLVQALSKLEAVFADVLLGSKCNLYLAASLMQDLDNQFMHHDFTIQSFQRGLKVCFVPQENRDLLFPPLEPLTHRYRDPIDHH